MSLFSFPWDAVQAELGEDGFPIYSRAYGATDLQEVYKTLMSNGVFMNYADQFQVRAAGDRMLAVKLGRCHIEGNIGYPDPDGSDEDFIIVPPANTQPRIDTVVLRRDKAISARDIIVDIISGTPSPNPVRPNLTRDEEIWELGIGDYFVPADSTKVEQRYFTDTRLETSRCGAVTPFMTIDTTSFYAKLEDAIKHDLAAVKVKTDAQIQKLNDEIDRVIYLSDRLTGGAEDMTCGCYKEIEQLKKLVYQLLGSQENKKYYFVGKELYIPPDYATFDNGKVTFASGSFSDKTLVLES